MQERLAQHRKEPREEHQPFVQQRLRSIVGSLSNTFVWRVHQNGKQALVELSGGPPCDQYRVQGLGGGSGEHWKHSNVPPRDYGRPGRILDLLCIAECGTRLSIHAVDAQRGPALALGCQDSDCKRSERVGVCVQEYVRCTQRVKHEDHKS
mgnify:CR=1 FL=1